MKTQYKIVDTNIYLLDAKEALHSFKPKKGVKNIVVIPYIVIEEMDRYKEETHTSRGYNARTFSQELKKIIQKEKNPINNPIKIGANHYIQIQAKYQIEKITQLLGKQFNESKNDDIILSIAYDLELENKGNVELVTNDTNLYVKGSSIGLQVNDWKAARSVDRYEDIYKGWRQIETEETFVEQLLNTNQPIPIEDTDIKTPNPNEYFAFIKEGKEIPYLREGELNSRDLALGIYLSRIEGLKNGGIIRVPYRASKNQSVMGIKSRNIKQSFALDALLRPEIKLVNLIGKAGTGKTLLGISSGLYQLETKVKKNEKNNLYESVIIAKPTVSSGPKLGYVPGDLEKKLNPWLEPIFDNVKNEMREELINKLSKSPQQRNALQKMSKTDIKEYLKEREAIIIQSLEHIRGRSFENAFILIDEAQNLDMLEVKTIITRAGENTKIVLTGDPQQIDKKGLTELTNGLCYSSEKLKEENISATILLDKGERSELAEIAASKL